MDHQQDELAARDTPTDEFYSQLKIPGIFATQAETEIAKNKRHVDKARELATKHGSAQVLFDFADPQAARPQATTVSVLICIQPLGNKAAPQADQWNDEFEQRKTKAFNRADNRCAYNRETLEQGSFEYVVRVMSSRQVESTLWNPVLDEMKLKMVADKQFLKEATGSVQHSHNNAMTKAATQDSPAFVQQVSQLCKTGRVTIAARRSATTQISVSDVCHVLRRHDVVPSRISFEPLSNKIGVWTFKFVLPSKVIGNQQTSKDFVKAIAVDAKLIAVFPLGNLPDQLTSINTFTFREQVLIFAFMKIVRPLAPKLLIRQDTFIDGNLPTPTKHLAILDGTNDSQLLENIFKYPVLAKEILLKLQTSTAASDGGALTIPLVREDLGAMSMKDQRVACAVFAVMNELLENVEAINISRESMSALVIRLRSGLVVVVDANFFGFVVPPIKTSAVRKVRGSIQFPRAGSAQQWLSRASPSEGEFEAAIFLDNVNDRGQAGLALRHLVAEISNGPMFISEDVALCILPTRETNPFLAAVRSDAELRNYPHAKTLTPPVLITTFLELFEEEWAKQVGEQLITLPVDPVTREKTTGLSYIRASERGVKNPQVMFRVEANASDNWTKLDKRANELKALPGVEYVFYARLSPGLEKFEYKLHSGGSGDAADQVATKTGKKECAASSCIKFGAKRLGLVNFGKDELTIDLGDLKKKFVDCMNQL